MSDKIKQENITLFFYLIIFILVDLILGGSGRVIAIGPISLRILLDFLLLFCFLVFGRIEFNTSNKLLSAILLYFFFSATYSLLINPIGNIIAEIKGYIPLLLCPVFIWYFRNHNRTDSLWKVGKVILRILAIVQLALWLYALVLGKLAYGQLSAFMEKFDYGVFAYVDSENRIPRVFLKASIFIFLGLIIEFSDLFVNKQHRIFNFVFFFVDCIALLTTFTLGFWLSAAICFVLYFFSDKHNRKITLKSFVLTALIAILGIIILIKFNVIEMINYRIASGSVSHKASQFNKLIGLWTHKPIFGYGFGYETQYLVEGKIVTRYMFENVWLQILFHNGLVGLILFGSYIVYTLCNLKKLYNSTKDTRILILWVALIYICMVSLFNPFINNSIGITFLAVCVGVSNLRAEKRSIRNIAGERNSNGLSIHA